MSLQINPVTLKELRQIVRSRIVAAGLIGLLAIALVAVTIVLLNEDEPSAVSTKYGTTVFHTIYILLCLLLLFALPYFVAIRMGAERSNEHLDLQFTTILKPRQFVDGKIAGAVVLVIFLISATLPFMVLAHFLRGLDLTAALISVVMLTMIVIATICAALLLAILAPSRVARGLLLLGGVQALPIMIGFTIAANYGLVSEGNFSLSNSSDFIVALVFCGIWLSLCLILRRGSIALISPAGSNRGPAFRWWVTGIWLFWGVIAVDYYYRKPTGDSLEAWGFLSVLAFALCSFISVALAPGYSRRVLARVSPHPFRRLMQFVFYSGAENGLVWALIMSLLTVIISAVGSAAVRPHSGFDDIDSFTIFILTILGYIWFARAIWLWWLARWISWRFAALAAIVLLLIGSAVPYVIGLGQGATGPLWVFGNVFAAFADDITEGMVGGAVLWILLALLVNLPGLARAFREFRPPADMPPPPPLLPTKTD